MTCGSPSWRIDFESRTMGEVGWPGSRADAFFCKFDCRTKACDRCLSGASNSLIARDAVSHNRETRMKSFAVLVFAAALASSGTVSRSPRPEAMVAQVRSVDSTQPPQIRITTRGRLFKSLGIDARATPSGSITLSGDSGTARGVVNGELSEETGELIFSTSASNPELVLSVWPKSGAALPRLYAHGHTVLVMRSAAKGLIVNGKP